MVDVRGAGVGVDDFGVGVGGGLDGLGEIEDGGFGAGADVVRLADGIGRGGPEVGPDDVVDVDEVAGLCPVAVDGDGLVVAGLFKEDGDDAGVGTVGLARAVDVEVAERDRVEAVQVVVAPSVMVDGEFVDAVGGVGLEVV